MVPFPFSNLDAAKKRPVLVLTRPDERGDFIGMAITSVLTTKYALALAADAVSEGALPKPSWLHLDKIFTLNISRIEGIFAQVSPAFRFRVVQELCLISVRPRYVPFWIGGK